MQKLLSSVFSTTFNLNKLKNLMAEVYQQPVEIEKINIESAIINSCCRLKTDIENPVILVLSGGRNFEWNFKVRKLLSEYLATQNLKQALVAFTAREKEDWYWTLVQRKEVSPYLLNCYSIPVGPTSPKSSLKMVEQTLQSEDLENLTKDFGSGLKEEFLSECRDCYELLKEELTTLVAQRSSETLPGDQFDLTQELLIKVIILYLLEQQDLCNLKIKSEEAISKQQKLIALSETEIIDLLLEEKKEVVLPPINSLKKVRRIIEKYEFSLIEDEPWAKVWGLSPAVLADLNEDLLTTDERKSNGVFYTPEQVVHYMGQESIINYLATNIADLSDQQAKNLVQEKNLASIEHAILPKIYDLLTKVKVCDPAVGSGAFALGMGKELVRTKEVVIELINDQISRKKLKSSTLKNSLHCVDIDQQAVEITKFRLWLWSEKIDLADLIDLEQQVVVANPLYKLKRGLEQKDAALESVRSNWQQQVSLQRKREEQQKFKELKREKLGAKFSLVDYFPVVFEQDGFDIVIANPPYVGEKGNKEIFREIKKYSLGRFYSGKMDLFYFFFHLALDITTESGIIALITTNYYLTATGAYYLREDLAQRGIIKKLIDFNNLRLFPAAIGQHNLITILQKDDKEHPAVEAETIVTSREGDAEQQTVLEILAGTDKQSNYYTVTQEKLYQGQEKYLRLEVGKIDSLLSSAAEQGQQLGELCQINQGIVSGCDKVSKRHLKQYNLPPAVKGAGIFVLTAAEVDKLDLTADEQKLMRPWFKNSDIEPYWSRCKNKEEYILYLKDKMEEVPSSIKNHLKPFRAILAARREVEMGRIKWWELQWPRQQRMFEGAKIVVPQRSKINTFAYNETAWYASADVYYITQSAAEVNLKYILALLNSSLYYLWFYYKGKKKGKLLELYQQPLTEVPIKVIDDKQQQIFIDLAEKIITKKKQLKEYQAIAFNEVVEDKQLTSKLNLAEIVKEAENFTIAYQGQAKIVRQMKVAISGQKIMIYSAKSSTGYYKLIEFELGKSELRKYLKFYLENLTESQLDKLNGLANSSIVDRLLALKISGYQDRDEIQAIVDYWEQIEANKTKLKEEIKQLEEEIDELVYQLYNFSPSEIEFLTKKVEELKID